MPFSAKLLKTVLAAALSFLRINDSDPGVTLSQAAAFAQQLPRLYIILGASAVALAATHFGTAPDSLTLYVPGTLLAVCSWRVAMWWRTRRIVLDHRQARRKLRASVLLSAALGILFSAWGFSLYPYGDAFARMHVVFFMAITTVGALSCLMQLPAAALTLTVAVAVPFTVFFASSSNVVLIAIAMNFGLVTIVLLSGMMTYYQNFTSLVHSRQDLEHLSRENHRLAHLDALTGIPNRRSFMHDLEALLAVSRSNKTPFALGIVDLDGFKPINDVYGHAAGDRVLVEVARRLQEVLGPKALVARLGGDEFGIILSERDDMAQVRARGEAVCRAMQEPFALSAGAAQIAASVGFSCFPETGQSTGELFERADYALYHAKGQQRGTAIIFTRDHDIAIRAQSRVEQELRQADLAAEMTILFQPIVEVGWDRVVAFEALARWNSPVLGAVPPDVFITAAERCGVINRLTPVLFVKALAAARTWPDDVSLSFNLSVRDIASPAAMAAVQDVIQNSGVRPERIVAEITETALMRDFAQARDVLAALKALGIRIALDDFGTGFSSLSYVHRLPLDTIKIDRSFIADIATDHASRDIIRSIAGLCRNLEIVCVMEGVETAEQIRILRTLGCTRMQGYHFGRPMTNDAALALLGSEQETARQAQL